LIPNKALTAPSISALLGTCCLNLFQVSVQYAVLHTEKIDYYCAVHVASYVYRYFHEMGEYTEPVPYVYQIVMLCTHNKTCTSSIKTIGVRFHIKLLLGFYKWGMSLRSTFPLTMRLHSWLAK